MTRRLAGYRHRVGLVGLVVFALAAASLFSASLFGGKVLSPNDLAFFSPPLSADRPAGLLAPSNGDLSDPINILDPQMIVARAAVRAGQLPLWDPSIGAGRPVIASQQAVPFFPLTWLAFFTPFWHSLVWIAAARLVLTALGMLVLCRALGLGLPASILGGLAFGFGTGPLVWAEHPLANVVAMTPWMFAFVERLWQRARLIDVIGLAGALGLGLLGGHPETFFVAVVGLVAFTLFRAMVHYRANGRNGLGTRVGQLVASGATGALIGGVAAVPLLELVAHAYHPSRNLLGPDPVGRMLSGSLFPEMFGRADKVDFIRTKLTVADFFAGRAVYVGALPLLIGVGGLAVRRSATQLFFAALGGLAALAVVGAPVLGYLVRHLPLFSVVYAHWFVWLSVLSATVLCAYGLEILLHADRAELARMAATMALAAGGAAAWGLTQVHGFHLSQALDQLPVLSKNPPSGQVAALSSVIRFVLLALILGVLVAVQLRSGRTAALAVAMGVIAVTVVDLLSIDRGWHPQISPARADPPTPASLQFLQAAGPEPRVIGEGPVLHPDLADRYGLYDARSEDLPMPDRVTSLFGALGGIVDTSIGSTLYDPRVSHARDLLNLFAARYVLALGPRGLGADAQLKPLFDRPGQVVLLNQTALPRAWIAYRWRPASGLHDALRQTVPVGAAELEQSPVVEGAAAPPQAPQPRATAAVISRATATDVTIVAHARNPAYLVLDDTYYPGWQATVDGRAAEIHPANVAFRAVLIPRGRHTVAFRYKPKSVLVGIVMTLAGLLTVLVLAGISGVRRLRLRGNARQPRKAAQDSFARGSRATNG